MQVDSTTARPATQGGGDPTAAAKRNVTIDEMADYVMINEAKLLKHPWKVFYNPKGSSWFNAAETLISVMKNRLSKAFALTLRDISTKEEFRELIEYELSKMVIDYSGNEMINVVVPELQQEIERYGKKHG